MPKEDLMRLWKVERKISLQHGGQSGSDTAWARLSSSMADAVDDGVLRKYGNGLKDALASISRLAGFKPDSFAAQFDA